LHSYTNQITMEPNPAELLEGGGYNAVIEICQLINYV